MPFDFHNSERLARQVERLGEARYRHVQELDALYMAEDPGRVAPPPPAQGTGQRLCAGDIWSGQDAYIWLSIRCTIPPALTGGEVVGLFDFGYTGQPGYGSFECLCYLDGTPHQGLDQNHREVFLPGKGPGDSFLLQFRLWSGIGANGDDRPRPLRLNVARLAVLDAPSDRLYFLLGNVLETCRVLEPNAPPKQRLLDLAVQAWNRVDTLSGTDDAFYASIPEAVGYIEAELAALPSAGNGVGVSVGLVGHSHIDVAWLWRTKHTREKCARTFSTALRLMERYPEYVFLQSQAQLYDYVKADFPLLYRQIKERVTEGRWEAAGSMWVECDCNLPGGESLVRQILYGTRFFEQEFDSHSTYLWLPDVFGYSAALPQILRKSGIDIFFTTKISWNDQNRLPYDTFCWRGIDGSEVLAHFITTPEPWEHKFYTYSGEMTPETVQGIWENYSNKGLNSDLLLAYGYGDGGGGPTRGMLENLQCLEKMPGLPVLRPTRVDDYCARLRETLNENPHGAYLPVWDGELYLEFHRGTYTSQARNKAWNRRLEFLLRDAELLVCHAMIAGRDVTKLREKLARAWKIVLLNQFHDIIPGSSIRQVYEDTEADYQGVQALLDTVVEAAREDAHTEDGWVFFNTANWTRDAIVTLPGVDGLEMLLEGMPPLSMVRVAEPVGVPRAEAEGVFDVNRVESRFYLIEWDDSGQLIRIYDKENGREVLAPGEKGNLLTLHEDRPRAFDAWELESTINEKQVAVTGLVEAAVETPNGLYQCVRFTWRHGDSSITQRMKLYSHTRRIDFETEVDWHQREVLLKVIFPVAVRAEKARYDIQFGSLERPATANTSWEFAQYEVVGHKWADLSEGGYGVALLNDCKYGYDIHGNVMRLTLLKASNEPDPEADRGLHRFTYALLPHAGTWDEADVDSRAWELNNSPLCLRGAAVGPLFECDSPAFLIDCIKPTETGRAVILRLHERQGGRHKLAIPVCFPMVKWCECNLLEREEGLWNTEPVLHFDLTPYEIKTFKLALE